MRIYAVPKQCQWLVIGCASLTLACDTSAPCPTCSLRPIHVVLTFDDGPLIANHLDSADASFETDLKALRDILATLERHQARGVFFVTPRTSQLASDHVATLARGLADIHAAGHVLGYHAFAHDPDIWINPTLIPGWAELLMNLDLERLQAWIDSATQSVGGSREEWFRTVFRQPYGGADFFVFEGVAVAAARSLTYRGYWIDSGDWLNNAEADPAIREKLQATTAEAQDGFVRTQLHGGALATQGREMVDVLLHVNELTASQLGDWLDQLSSDFGSAGGAAVQFDVPEEYLTATDSFVDPGVGAEILRSGRDNQTATSP